MVVSAFELLKTPATQAKTKIIVMTQDANSAKGFVTLSALLNHGNQLVPEDFSEEKALEVGFAYLYIKPRC